MTFLQPIWLLCIIPLLLLIFFRKPHSKFLASLRVGSLSLIVLSLMQPQIMKLSQDGIVLVLADQSLSMPRNVAETESEIIHIIENNKAFSQKTAVISFAENAVLEKSPRISHFSSFSTSIDKTGSNLQNAVDLALSVIPENTPAKVLILSDGCFTAGKTENAAARFASSDIPCDFRLIKRSTANDLAITSFKKPDNVNVGEFFQITVWFYAPLSGEITYSLKKNKRLIIKKTGSFSSGINKINFFDKASKSGTLEYVLKINNQYKDPVPENNSAKILVGVNGPKPILLLSNTDNPPFASLLAKSGVNIEAIKPELFDSSLTGLSAYSALIIENIAANQIGMTGLENIASWISDSGAGLMITGGKNSFALGGYFDSPIERILPVSMELKQEHRKFSIAIVVVLDRSGSMSMTLPDGRSKMDLANISTVQVLDLISPIDEFGVIAVDSSPHTILRMQTKSASVSYAKPRIKHIQSMGGGIFIYEGLLAGVNMISGARAGNKHIILFADASDSEEEGDYVELLKHAAEAGITVSVIGLGSPADCDAALLKDVAKRGAGQCFFSENPHDLPRLFAQDTFIVARNSFVDEPVTASETVDSAMITPEDFGSSFPLGGYNLTYLKPGANIAAVSNDEYNSPITAFQHAGAGRVLCFTGEVNGKYTAPLDSWKHYSDYFSALTSWTAGRPDNFENMVLSYKTLRSVCTIRIHLDPDRSSDPFSKLPFIKTIVSSSDSHPKSIHSVFSWEDADTLSASLNMKSNHTYLTTVFAGNGKQTLPPICLPFSQEFNIDHDSGELALKNIASATGGRAIADFSDVWKNMPEKRRTYSIAKWLILVAVIFFFLEILERRTLALSSLNARFLKGNINYPKYFAPRKSPTPSKNMDKRDAPSTLGESDEDFIKKNHNIENKISEQDELSHSNSLSNALKKAKKISKK